MANQATNDADRQEELEKKLHEIELKQESRKYEDKAKKAGLPFSDFKSLPINNDALSVIEESVARSSQLAPVHKSGKRLTVALTDPQNKATQDLISELKGRGFELNMILTSPAILESILKRYANIKRIELFEVGAIDINEEEMGQIQGEIKNISDLKDKVVQIPVTKILEVLIAGALQIGASDVHFEPEQERARLRYRIDGVLNDVTFIDKLSYKKIVNRLKILSKLKLNITNAPQDGRFSIRQVDVTIEVRVSILPSEYGETIVMRLLDPRTIKKDLKELGIREDLLKLIMEQLARSTGAILTTGPTGSGKTTSLYAFLNFLNSPGTKIVTIEDPIEYHINGVSQTQVEPEKGYDFANGLRAIVRQDPDVILVGEIRDAETAGIALHAALTGHLVFSTIHTNNAAGTIPRLIDLGIEPQIIAPAINMAMAQRLLRRLCPNCKKEEKVLSPNKFEKIKEALLPIKDQFKLPEINDKIKIFSPGTCKECNETGYKGRIGVYEAFLIKEEMERLILTSPAISDIEALAVKNGMVTMLQDAYMKLLEGTTSLEEIERVLS